MKTATIHAITTAAICTLLAARADTVVLTNSDAFGATSFDAALNWSDGQPPSGTNDYVVTSGYAVRTPPVAGSLTFAGNALTLGDGATSGMLNYKGNGDADIITISNLTMNLGIIGNGQTPTNPLIMAGDITLGTGGGAFDQGAGGRSIMVSSVVAGVGGVLVYSAAGAGTVTLAADNTYEGPTTIATGTLVIGTGLAAGRLGGGAVTNRGTLVLNRGDSSSFTNSYAGPLGAFVVRAGEVTLSGQAMTNATVAVADAAGPVAHTVLHLSNSVVVAGSGANNSFWVGGVANTAASGTVNMTGGQLLAGGELWIAMGAGNSRGYFNLYDGQVRVSNWTAIGRSAAGGQVNSYGELNISGGSWSNVANNNISLASFLGNTGVVNLTGGRLYAQNALFVGESGMGYLNVGNTGEADVNNLTIGDRNTGAGAVVITGGVVHARNAVGVANAAATAGTLDMSAGELAANSIYAVGTAAINLSGGQIGPHSASASFSVPMTLTTTSPYGGDGTVTFRAQTVAGATANIDVHRALSGDGAIVKTGKGALLLNDICTYTGPTAIHEGHLFGTGSVVSAITVSNAAFLGPNSLQYIGTFVAGSSVTLENGAGLSAFLNGGAPSLVVFGTLTAGGANPVNLLPTFAGVTPGTNTLLAYVALSAFTFTTGTLPAGVQGYLQDNPSLQTIEFVVTNVAAGAGLVWSGAVDGNWDAQTTTNWIDGSSSLPALFNHGDSVRFDDTGTNTAVNIPVAVTPGAVTISNNTVAYSFGGSGIIGPATITKEGAGTAVIRMASTHTGTNVIRGGTLVASNAAALGSVAGPTVISGGGTLDTGGQNLGGEPVVLSGAGVGGRGAIVNNGPAANQGLRLVTLAGDATIGGSNRWDVRTVSPQLDLNGFTLTKTGVSYIALADGITVTNAGDLVINEGTLGLEFAASVFSGPGSIVVNPGGVLGLYQAASIWKTNVYNGGTVRSVAGGGANLIGAPVVINTNTTIEATGGNMSFTNVISGPAGFTKTAGNALILLATNTYTGPTFISAGSVMLGNGVEGNGTLGGGNVTNNSQLIFNRPDSHVVTNAIAGTGQLLARSGATTLQDTSVTNNALFVLDGAAVANATLNIAGSRVYLNNAANNNCNVGMVNGGALTGTVNMSSGYLRSGHEIWIAAGNTNSRGIFNLSGGDVSIANWSAIGRGTGTGPRGNYGEINISGGTWSNITAGNFTIGSFLGNTGRVSVTGGRLYTANTLWVAESGAGFMRVAGSAVVDVARFSVAQAANGAGVFDIAGGSIAARSSDNIIGVNASAYGWLPMSGGTMTIAGNFQVGGAGIGVMEMSGNASVSATAGYPVIGRSIGGRGVLDVSGGSFTHNNSGTFLIVGEQGGGILNIRGAATVTVHSARTGDGARLGHNVGTGLVTVASGGTLVAPAVTRAASGNNTGILDLDGGTLRANNNNAAYAANLNAIHIRPGGARIDDGGFAITITQALATATGSGLAAIPVVTGGSGYMGPPVVQIAGGGRNATALAQVDAVAGTLTNIVVTSPGSDFAGLPAVTLAGGAPVLAATLGTPVLAANVSGGLVKLGAGTLTLSASNTYAGATDISQGTLTLGASASLDSSTTILVRTGATFNVSAKAAYTVPSGQTLSGGGQVQGSLVVNGTVAPGASAGQLTVTGQYSQAATGTLAVEIGGTTQGVDYDFLSVGGNANLDGTLSVTLVNGYTGTVGDIQVILSAAGGGGAFAVTNLPVLADGKGFAVQYLGTAVILSVTGGTAAAGYDLFAQQITNAADRGYQNDPDGDGYANLLEYATGGNPTNADGVAGMNGGRTNGLLTLTFKRNTNALDATLIVEGSYATTNESVWTGLATNSAGSWGGAPNVTETGGGNPVDVTAEDTDPAATNRFLRLRVTRP